MTQSAFVLFFAAILSEIFLLFEAANPDLNEPGKNFFAGLITPARFLAAIIAAIAFGLVGLFELFKTGHNRVYIDTSVFGFFFIILGVAVIFVALLSKMFVPLVNEQSIMMVQCLLVVGALWNKQGVDWLPNWLLVVPPLVVIAALLIWRRALPGWLKVILYLWHLLSLLILPFQTGEVAFFRMQDPTWVQAYLFGFLFIFMIVHGLFALRFFLIASSLVWPHNRPEVEKIMPYLFSDEQVPLSRFVLASFLVAALMAVNEVFHFLDRSLALSISMMIVVQILSWKKSNPGT